jgi:DNA segregation ATPase FtsK/SpoIIIE, S-DNA-T family
MSDHNQRSWGRRRRRPTPTRPPRALSMYDPVHFGIDENGHRVEVTLAYRNLLAGGEPGSGKSSLLNTIIAHAALSSDAKLWLFDGKIVELGLWRPVADVFVGNSITDALTRLVELQAEMELRYRLLEAAERRKILRIDPLELIVCVIDELAYYTATIGTKDEQEQFRILLRDLVARGRAAGIIVIAATQRPSADIIPTSLRDLFGYRVAFRCTTDSSSDIILSVGWASEGYSAKDIAPEDRGVGLLLAEGGIPRRFKAAYLTDAQIRAVIAAALQIRNQRGPAA